MSNLIVRAQHEVFLATNFWQNSGAARYVVSALRELSRRAGARGARVVVRAIRHACSCDMAYVVNYPSTVPVPLIRGTRRFDPRPTGRFLPQRGGHARHLDPASTAAHPPSAPRASSDAFDLPALGEEYRHEQ